ncbi:MAG: ABC transporter ATP-binding protein [Acidobacteria bacterium]|nr:ABC transporter ATP-binding protein [Acidobacteriota bacterium]
MIELIHLTKKYGNLTAVDDLTLKIEEGEFFGFLGPNGAGKTTTIRMITGLIRPTSGRIILGGYDLAKEPLSAKKIVGFIPDRPFLYEKLSGREFLRFVAELYGMRNGIYRRRVEELLSLFELSQWGDELVESYSHGMRQRLVFSAALIHNPKIIVVDEPMVGLDPKGMRLIKEIFQDFVRKGGTIFMSTHTLSLAEELCHRIGIIHQGKLIALGTKEEIRRKAKLPESRLEDIFITLTREENEGLGIAHPT